MPETASTADAAAVADVVTLDAGDPEFLPADYAPPSRRAHYRRAAMRIAAVACAAAAAALIASPRRAPAESPDVSHASPPAVAASRDVSPRDPSPRDPAATAAGVLAAVRGALPPGVSIASLRAEGDAISTTLDLHLAAPGVAPGQSADLDAALRASAAGPLAVRRLTATHLRLTTGAPVDTATDAVSAPPTAATE